MAQKIHTLSLEVTMELMNEISKIDRFDASWSLIEKQEGQTLKQLKEIATVESVGASTRIEGSKMTDAEVEVLLEKLKVTKLEERDQQEVAGYFETLEIISESYQDINIKEASIQHLHKILLSRSDKDEEHRGKYKRVANTVEVKETKHVIFRTAEPGMQTEDGMRNLIEWYRSDKKTHPIIKSALFVYEFLSIHPFKDGNGRLSRLLGTLLLLRDGYSWIQYVSFEHEIENRKAEYYRALVNCQKNRPGESVDEWIIYFLDCLANIQTKLMDKFKKKTNDTLFSPKENNILTFIQNHPGAKSSDIAQKLNMPLSTVKKILTSMVGNKQIIKYGAGAGTNYLAEKTNPIKSDLMFQLTDAGRKKEFLLMNSSSFVEIKKIILTPLFDWVKPDDWARRLLNNGLYIKITGYNNRGNSFSSMYTVDTFNSPYYFQPVFILTNPINIPISIKEKSINLNEYPIKIEVELFGSVPAFDFDVMFVYDAIL